MIKKGDFVQVEYTANVATTSEVFDTTDKEVAKKEKIFNTKQRYGPLTVCVGEAQLVSGLDDSLVNKKEGDSYEIDLTPEQGFGQRSAKLIQLTSLAKFKGQRYPPFPGAQFVIDGMPATVRAVSGGRVILDFNHSLAGKALHYKVKVVKMVTDAKEQASSVVEKLLPPEMFSLELNEGTLKIKFNKDKDKLKPFEKIIEIAIQKAVKEVKKVVFE